MALIVSAFRPFVALIGMIGVFPCFLGNHLDRQSTPIDVARQACYPVNFSVDWNSTGEIDHGDGNMTDAQIKYMVNRFLDWRLPADFSPDAGISYERPNYAHDPSAIGWPTGTNLLDANQADAMVRYMLDGLP